MQIMSIFGGKRLETVPVKFSESEKAELQRLAQLEDRGVGYIVRELAFRGLAQYKQDGLLKLTADEENVFTAKPQVRQVALEKVAAGSFNKQTIVKTNPDEDMGLQFSGGKRRTGKQNEDELNRQMDEAIAKVKKNKKS